MDDQREVSNEQAIEFAKENSISQIFETSAKTGYNVEEVFTCVGKELYLQAKQEVERRKLDLEDDSNKGRGTGDNAKAKKDIKLKKNNEAENKKTDGGKQKKKCC